MQAACVIKRARFSQVYAREEYPYAWASLHSRIAAAYMVHPHPYPAHTVISECHGGQMRSTESAKTVTRLDTTRSPTHSFESGGVVRGWYAWASLHSRIAAAYMVHPKS